jgi:hypothetical protein
MVSQSVCLGIKHSSGPRNGCLFLDYADFQPPCHNTYNRLPALSLVSNGYWWLFPSGIKWLGCETDHLLPCSGGTIVPLPYMSSCHDALLINNKEDFTCAEVLSHVIITRHIDLAATLGLYSSLSQVTCCFEIFCGFRSVPTGNVCFPPNLYDDNNQ